MMSLNFSVSRGYLGVIPQELGFGLAQALGLEEATGALVVRVLPDGPGARAGIRRGDVITALNGVPLPGCPDLERTIGRSRPGSRVKITVRRDGNDLEFPVRIGRRPFDIEKGENPALARKVPGPTNLGFLLKSLTPEFGAELGVEGRQGVVVAGVIPDTPAARTSLHPGDLIRELDRQPVASVEEFSRLARILEKGDTALLFVQRGRETFFEAIDVTGARY